jgi:hypothetical protein
MIKDLAHITHFPLCPKLRSLLRYAACAQANKAADARDDNDALEKSIVMREPREASI